MAMHGQWPPYVLYPSAPDEGRPHPEIVETRPTAGHADWFEAVATGNIQSGIVWPLDVVVKNFVVSIAGMLLHADAMKKRVDDDDIDGLLNTMKRVARDLPYGGPVRDEMLAVASHLESIRQGLTQNLQPGFRVKGMRHEHQLRLNSLVFALDRILRTAKELEPRWAAIRKAEHGQAAYLDFDLAGTWERWLGHLGVDAQSVSDDAMRERITRFKKNIRPHHEDALVRDILSDLLTHGYFLPDGTLRRPDTVSRQ